MLLPSEPGPAKTSLKTPSLGFSCLKMRYSAVIQETDLCTNALKEENISMHLHKRLALITLSLSLIALTPSDLFAIGEEAPIIAMAGTNIYAVSPVDGEARLLVERSPEQDEALNDASMGMGLSLSQISPDNTKFAYTAPLYEVLDPAFDSKREDIADIRPVDLTLVDIATGEQTPITNQGDNLAEAVAQDKLTTFTDIIWSADGQRLYFVANRLSMRNRAPQRTIEFYDVASGEKGVLVQLNPRVQLVGIYAASQGVVLLDGAQNQSDYTFTLYAPDGSIINAVDMELFGTIDCTNGAMFDLNPVFKKDDYHYGYYGFEDGEAIPTLLDVASGDSFPLDVSQFPSFMSHANHSDSLRVVHANLCYYADAGEPWVVTDAEGVEVTSMPLNDINGTYEMAISPAGQSIAYIYPYDREFREPGAIIVMDAQGTRELDFKANQIRWGAIDFTFAPYISRG